jgi:GTPase
MKTEQQLKAILIDCAPPEISQSEAKARLDEAESLVKTYGGVVLIKTVQKKMKPEYKTYIGQGKLEELRLEGKALGANILIVNNELKPMQTYNLGEALREDQIEVWDRPDLILRIFQKHAKTKEAKLEIELASIKHMGPRIYGMGIQLSRQMGGIGGRGIGETNLEIMKRHLVEHARKIEKDLEKCAKERALHRAGRERKNLKVVSIIGYTNVGKTSLLNALTHKGAYSANLLFATLDTRIGSVWLNGVGKEVLVSDTIGFIRDLPPDLIRSFHSTLQETIHADLLLHVIDLSDPRYQQKIAVVNQVLADINAHDKPTIYVFNKIDRLPRDFNHQLIKKMYSRFTPVFTSTMSGEGLEKLKAEIERLLFKS